MTDPEDIVASLSAADTCRKKGFNPFEYLIDLLEETIEHEGKKVPVLPPAGRIKIAQFLAIRSTPAPAPTKQPQGEVTVRIAHFNVDPQAAPNAEAVPGKATNVKIAKFK